MPATATAAAPFRLATRSGLVLDVRPAMAEDEPALAAFFAAVSPEDRRFRFFNAAPVGHGELDPLVHPDHFRTESFLAFDAASGALVASAMLACDNAMDTAEVAVSIRADYRGRGVGWSLLALLSEEGRRRGVRRVIAIEDRANHAAIELERESGFLPETCEIDPGLLVLSRSFR